LEVVKYSLGEVFHASLQFCGPDFITCVSALAVSIAIWATAIALFGLGVGNADTLAI
jgi:hypothetical protein